MEEKLPIASGFLGKREEKTAYNHDRQRVNVEGLVVIKLSEDDQFSFSCAELRF